MKKNYILPFLGAFIFCSFQLFSQWTQPTVTGNTGDDLQAVSFGDDNTVFATGWSGVVYKSTDAGASWNKLTTTIPVIDMYACLFLDANTGFVAGDVGRIYKTTDGGSTWTQKTSGTTETFYGFTKLNNNTTIYAYGSSGVMKKSTDSGETWSTVTAPTGLNLRNLSFLSTDENIAYLVGDNSGGSTVVYKSTDGAGSWSTQMLPISTDGDPVNLYGLSIVDANNVFVCGGSKRISKTSNGSTWSNINSAIANFYRSCWFTSSTEGYVVGGNGKILKSINGSTFTTETTGVTDLLSAITRNSGGTYIVVGAAGRILRLAGATTNNAPTANDDASTTEFNTPVTTTVLSNDTDPDANPLTVSIVSQSPNGNAVVNGDGSITFTPTSGFSGTTTYTYQACDNGTPALCDQATVTITVNPGVVDNDGDGSPAGTDCNDSNSAIYPGAPEICDGLDNNCDGNTDEGLAMTTYYTDADMDGYGSGSGTDYCNNPGAGYSTLNTDCNDAAASINPGVVDIPNNGIDEDCNGSDATTATDNDGDGVDSASDCDDNNPTVYPGATEICDGLDNNCDGNTDEGLAMTTYYVDADMDGYGSGAGTDYCNNPGAGYSTLNTDCNDAAASINPGATDIPNNGIDEDCNGSDATTATDNDGDGVDSASDCDDNDPTVYPGATEICDFKDNNCDGNTDEGLAVVTYYLDADMDSFGAGSGTDLCMNPGLGFSTVDTDCNDAVATINPGATDIPDNGIDEDCNGSDATANTDNDGDGVNSTLDCDDNNANIYPGAVDIPNNGIDEDCSGSDATSADPVANDDAATCVENGLSASISILTNDNDPNGVITNLTHTVDLDVTTAGIQNSFNAISPAVSWIYNTTFQTLSCDPGLDVEGTVTLIYELCNNTTGLCDQAVVTVTVTPSTASIDEKTITFALFPNPADGELTIQSSTPVKAVKVFGFDGRLVKESKLNAASGIQVSDLNSGLYHIELTFDNGAVSRSTFMRQ